MSASHAHDYLKHVIILLMVAGLCALVLYLMGQGYELGRLPGDLAIAVAEYNLYFPASTMVLVSAALNLTAYLCYSLIRHRLHMHREHAVEDPEKKLVYPK